MADRMTTLHGFSELGVDFVSLTAALDLTTPTGRTMAGLLAIFAEFAREILRERVRVGIAQARKEGRPHGRPLTAARMGDEVHRLKAERMSHSEIARRLRIGRTSVRRILAAGVKNGLGRTDTVRRHQGYAALSISSIHDFRQYLNNFQYRTANGYYGRSEQVSAIPRRGFYVDGR